MSFARCHKAQLTLFLISVAYTKRYHLRILLLGSQENVLIGIFFVEHRQTSRYHLEYHVSPVSILQPNYLLFYDVKIERQNLMLLKLPFPSLLDVRNR